MQLPTPSKHSLILTHSPFLFIPTSCKTGDRKLLPSLPAVLRHLPFDESRYLERTNEIVRGLSICRD